MLHKLILVINPGSTSTKIAVFENRKSQFFINIKHPQEVLASFPKITDQYEFRKSKIMEELKKAGVKLSSISIVVGREVY